MRYRALEASGRSISAVTLSLAPDLAPKEVRALAVAGLESGINAFELNATTPAVAAALGEAVRSVDRNLSFVSLRLGGGFDPRGGARPPRDYGRAAILEAAKAVLAAGGFGRLDLLLLDDPQPEEAPPESFGALESARACGQVGMIGVSGEGKAVDAALATGRLDVLAATYNLRSGWPQRHRLNGAAEAGVRLFGERFMPDMRGPSDKAPDTAGKGLLGGLFKRREPPSADAYAFLDRTPGWRGDEVCLGYALTEPALSSVLIAPRTPDDVARLAEVTDRDLPAGLGAQIEMARFAKS